MKYTSCNCMYMQVHHNTHGMYLHEMLLHEVHFMRVVLYLHVHALTRVREGIAEKKRNNKKSTPASIPPTTAPIPTIPTTTTNQKTNLQKINADKEQFEFEQLRIADPMFFRTPGGEKGIIQFR